ncbi:hypothetical protein A3B32_03115 [Candidatus Uhrbacteria bacterium RIFCSPLOWO2_01_FULL_53_9]|uniref:Uncharacterized protein n=2 Tax=Candidatus Uhriibacteriota TaxID=1752732 RepID=A0A1F7V031_9BACT|nr:MAG: hypothetical protein A3B32_03115 [Candidatus Uhrbacteria bacterium RIFCSPLOWO2_01_FULL_53_9]OGL89148.1 MAG: hypothetical protein A3I45_03110 [Candidatus Uhrbacteria bacterium RIFCSPLOWO2_02_FULL_53_10]
MKMTADVYARLLVDVCLDVAGARLRERVADVLRLMHARGDGHLARHVPEAVEVVYADQASVEEVTLTAPLDEPSLTRAIARALNRHAEDVRVVTDEQLIGGVKVRVGNTVIDASVQGALAQLRSHLTRAK